MANLPDLQADSVITGRSNQVEKIQLRVTKDIRNICYCSYVKCATLIDRVERMSWPQTGATYYHVQLGISDKGRAIKELVVCWMLLNLLTRVFRHKSRNMAPLSYHLLLFLLKCNG